MPTGESLPPGLTLDAQTGVINGTTELFNPTNPWYWSADIIRTITDSSGQTFENSVGIWPKISVPSLSYSGAIFGDLHLKRAQLFNFGPPVRADFIDGDTVGSFALASDGSTDAPSWMHIDPVTGELTATPPSWAALRMYTAVVKYTVTRNRMALQGSSFVSFYVD